MEQATDSAKAQVNVLVVKFRFCFCSVVIATEQVIKLHVWSFQFVFIETKEICIIATKFSL